MIVFDWVQFWFVFYCDVVGLVFVCLVVGQLVYWVLGYECFELVGLLVVGYEQYIVVIGCVFMCDNVYDLFNGLVWLCCLVFKVVFNVVYIVVLLVLFGQCGLVCDVLMLLDESGLLLVVLVELWQVLWVQDWMVFFDNYWVLWCQVQVCVVGYVLLEKLLILCKLLCVCVLLVDDVEVLVLFVVFDFVVLLFLFVFGIFGWWVVNVLCVFYVDVQVFWLKWLVLVFVLGGIVC